VGVEDHALASFLKLLLVYFSGFGSAMWSTTACGASPDHSPLSSRWVHRPIFCDAIRWGRPAITCGLRRSRQRPAAIKGVLKPAVIPPLIARQPGARGLTGVCQLRPSPPLLLLPCLLALHGSV